MLPNGDVLTAEALSVAGGIRSVFDYAILTTMRRAAAVGASPNRITLLRDADGDGSAETKEPFLEGLNQPFGIALVKDMLYVGNTDGVLAFPYAEGETQIRTAGQKLTVFKSGGHWTRNLLASPDGRRLFAAWARSPISATRACKPRRSAPPSTRSICRAGRGGSSPAAFAIPSVWRSSRPPAACGRWSTNATASATRRRPTI